MVKKKLEEEEETCDEKKRVWEKKITTTNCIYKGLKTLPFGKNYYILI